MELKVPPVLLCNPKALNEVKKHPSRAKGFRDLASAYESKGRTADAINALQQYTTLKPKVSGAWSEPQPAPSEADVRWRPARRDPASLRGERQVSTLDGARAPRSAEEGALYVLRALEG